MAHASKDYPGISGKENYLKAVKDIIDSKTDRTKTVLIWGYHKSWHGQITLKDIDSVTSDDQQLSGNAQPMKYT
jgi:hypothetical protein